jgi:ADP-heptose:LPS heptosyltransferase
MNVILVIAEWSSNFQEHFTPLVKEIRAHYVGAVVHGLLHRVCLPNTLGEEECSSSVPFDSLVVSIGDTDLTTALRLFTPTKVIVLIKHSGSPGDFALYHAVPAVFPQAIFLLKNLIKLQEFFRSDEDQAAEIARVLHAYRRKALEIWLKVRLVYSVGSVLCLLVKLLSPFRKSSNRHKILFIRLDVLGDMVLSLPSLLAIRNKYPNSEITLLVSRRSGIIVEEQQRIEPDRFCDRLVYWQAPWHAQKETLLGVKDFIRLFGCIVRLFRERYDVVLQPVELGTGVLFAVLLNARLTVSTIAERLPLARFMSKYVQAVRLSPYKLYHIADLPDYVAEAIGCQNINLNRHRTLLVSNQEISSVTNILAAHGWDGKSRVIAVNVGAGNPRRRWSPRNYSILIDKMRQVCNLYPVIVGGADECELGEMIVASVQAPVLNLVAQLDLNQLIALLSLSCVVITPDTGVMHIAAALNRKIVAIFGAGLVPFCRPLCSDYLIVKHELGCSGCGDFCFTDGEAPCIAGITVEMVFEAFQTLQLKGGV